MIQNEEFKIKAKFNHFELAHFLKQNLASKREITEISKKSKNCKWNEWKSNCL